MVEIALKKALAAAKGMHTAEIEVLEQKLAEAEAKSQRAVSQAQLTKSGHVYVISNIGAFGEELFKIGMTRRLEPQDRVDELGDASVPFPFDVHLMISTDDAPALENALHREFHKKRLNKVNLRKEFFRVRLDEVIEVVKNNFGEVSYRADAEALQYRNSLKMSDEDLELLQEVFEDEEESEIATSSQID
ncbi:MAG: GIY-YIG nuclease family protein [Pirellulales bacterium]